MLLPEKEKSSNDSSKFIYHLPSYKKSNSGDTEYYFCGFHGCRREVSWERNRTFFDFLKNLKAERGYDGIELQVNAKNKAVYKIYSDYGVTNKSINMELL